MKIFQRRSNTLFQSKPRTRRLILERLENRIVLSACEGISSYILSLDAADLTDPVQVMQDLQERVDCADETERPDQTTLPKAIDVNESPDIFETVLVAYERELDLGTGEQTTVWTYNGTTPGPAIDMDVGDTLIVHFYNLLPEMTTVHWHGVDTPANMDGSNISQGGVPSGGYFRYEFDMLTASQFWYHPHRSTNVQIEKGLYGSLMVREPNGEDFDLLHIPSENEHVLMLDDVLLDQDSQIAAPFPTDPLENAETHVNGREGNYLLVNGEMQPTKSIQKGVPHRLRLVNASNSRFMRVSIPGHTMWRVGGDGGLLEQPIEIQPIDQIEDPNGSGMISDPDPNKGILLTPGERADVVFVPTGDAPLTLQWHDIARGRQRAFYRPNGGISLEPDPDDGKAPVQTLMTFQLVGDGESQYEPPDMLREITPIDTDGAEPIVLTFGHGQPNPAGEVGFFAQLHSNGSPLPFSLVTPDDAPIVEVGETRIWEIHNLTAGTHNFHPHGFSFQPIELQYIDWVTPENNYVVPYEYLEVKDTILLPGRLGARNSSRTILRAAVTFDDTGREGQIEAYGKEPTETISGGWVVHCHMLEHSASGMITFFQVVEPPATKPNADITGPFQLTMGEGEVLQLDASGSSDQEQSTGSLTYLWDFDNDGEFDDAVGIQPDFSAVDLDGRSGVLVRLKVIDNDGYYDGDKAYIIVENVAPQLQVTGDSDGVAGQIRQIILSPTDQATADQNAGFTYHIDWGNGTPIQVVHGAAGSSFENIYHAAGEYLIRVTATDKDGGTSLVAEHAITITDELSQGSGIDFTINGTDQDDIFRLVKRNTGNEVEVFLNGVSHGIHALPGRIRAYGLGGDDTFIGTWGGFDIYWEGGEGNDVSYTHDGNDSLFGGAGDDTIIVYAGNNIVDAGLGNNKIRSGYGRDFIVTGDTGNNDIRDAGGNNRITTGNGDNIIYTGIGHDWIRTGSGNDTITSRGGNNRINAQDGLNKITTASGDNQIRGGNDRDVITSYSGSNTVVSFSGDDSIAMLGEGDDFVSAGDGRDYVFAGLGNDSIRGGHGDDLLLGSFGSDTLFGGDGNDSLLGGSGKDLLIGGHGEDQLSGQGDADILIAGGLSYAHLGSDLAAIMREWTSLNSYTDRVANITTGGGENGSTVLNRASSVRDDTVRDELFGGGEMDLFFALVPDELDDRTAEELSF